MASKRIASRRRTGTDQEIPNQVFLAIPWRNVRPKYEEAIEELRKSYPLSFVIIGREKTQDAKDLLEVIKSRLLSSSYAIFDATGGNANVSLEYGFAEAHDIPRALYVSTHKRARRIPADAPIIADLAGKRRNQYAQGSGLKQLLEAFASEHPYTKRFEHFLSTAFRRRAAGQKRSARALALKIIHHLSGDGTARRADVVQALLALGYKRWEVDEMIQLMHRNDLIQSLQGPHSTLTIT